MLIGVGSLTERISTRLMYGERLPLQPGKIVVTL